MKRKNLYSCCSLIASAIFCSSIAQAAEQGPADSGAAPAADQGNGDNVVGPADEQDRSDSGLNDIVVTATRRSENLQDVPVTVSAMSGEQMAQRGITDVTDLSTLAPGLNVTRQTSAPVIYMRGVGVNSPTAGNEQNVAVYIDGVYMPSIGADLGSFGNIERVEVLKGPQGTLFGRNTTGGLIQLITKDPTQTPTGNASFGYSNYETFDVAAYVAGGIAPNLAADISVNYQNQRKGWGTNLVNGEETHLGKSLTLRSKWVWTPSDRTKLTLAYMHSQSNSNYGTSYQVLSSLPLPPAFGSSARPDSIYDATGDERDFGTKSDQDSVSLKVEQELGGVKLTSITAYLDTANNTHFDLDFTAGRVLVADYPDHTSSFSQEIQIASNNDSRLSWIVGGLYFYSNARQDSLDIRSGPTRVLAASYDTGLKTYSPSLFGQATYAITDDTNLIAGARYTVDRKALYGTLTALTPNGYVEIMPDDSTRKKTFKNFSFKVGVDHHFTPDVMAYATVSTGFKSGLYNVIIGGPFDRPVNPEKLTDYEIGVKTELFDRTVRLNVSGFYYDYKDIQLQTFTGNASVTVNAAAAKIYGLETELVVAPTEGLTLTSAATLMSPKYRTFLNAPSYGTTNPIEGGVGVGIPGFDASGNQLLRAPKFTLDASANYRVPVSFGAVEFNLSYYHNGGFYWESDNRLRQPAYDLINGSIALFSADEAFNVRLWVKNLTDEKYYLNQISGRGAPDVGLAAAPRTYGASVGFKF